MDVEDPDRVSAVFPTNLDYSNRLGGGLCENDKGEQAAAMSAAAARRMKVRALPGPMQLRMHRTRR
ncbi:MAG: hypothetical protein M3456_02330 [Actinomycetota bacterium]|jgi:hypothetical protein|nr:hypothetical protein [Actinomycetota bacterium]